MDEQEARDNVRPLGNVYPLEPEEKPYPDAPLASRRAPAGTGNRLLADADEMRLVARRRVMARILNLRTEADELERRLERGEV